MPEVDGMTRQVGMTNCWHVTRTARALIDLRRSRAAERARYASKAVQSAWGGPGDWGAG